MNSLRLIIGLSTFWLLEASSTALAIQLVLYKWCLRCDFEEHAFSLVDLYSRIRFWFASLVTGWYHTHMSCHLLFIVSVRLWFVFLFHVSLVSGATANIICLGIKKSKLFINSKVFLGLESVFLKCVYIWWLYCNLTDVSLHRLQIKASLKDGQVIVQPSVTSLQTALVIRPWC